MANYGFDLQRKNKAKNKKKRKLIFVCAFLCFTLVLGSASFLMLWKSLNYDFNNFFQKSDETTGVAETTAQQVTLPVKQNEVIGELNVSNPYDNVVERIDGAPELGVPADFSKPARYLVKNIAYRPAGVPQVTRLYEVRVTFVDKEE